MGLPRSNKSNLSQEKCFPHSNIRRRSSNVASLSQPVPSTSTNDSVLHKGQTKRYARETFSQPESSSDRTICENENQFVNDLIRYLFALDRGKQVISKTRIIKNVFGVHGKYFHRTLNKAKSLLSKIFGYRLVEFEANKYILINEIENSLPHIYPFGKESNQQVLLFIVLTHIFMHDGSCTEESLWSFLTNFGAECSNNSQDSYFGNVKHLITEVFVAKKYLDKITVEKKDSLKVEFKWGPRADYEFSPRKSLEFVSQIYNGRSIDSWPSQFKTMIAREKSNNLQC